MSVGVIVCQTERSKWIVCRGTSVGRASCRHNRRVATEKADGPAQSIVCDAPVLAIDLSLDTRGLDFNKVKR